MAQSLRLTREKAFILQRMIACWNATAWTGDAKFCVSTGLSPVLNIGGNSISLCADGKSRDAKSCVSQGSSANIVIGLSHAYIAMDCSGDSWNEDMESNNKQHQLNWRGRETQDFASLLGWRRYFYHSYKGYRDYSR